MEMEKLANVLIGKLADMIEMEGVRHLLFVNGIDDSILKDLGWELDADEEAELLREMAG